MDATTRQALEAILFVVDEPVDETTLSQVLEVGRREVEAELAALAEQLRQERRGFVLRQVAGGWRLYTAAEAAPYIERWVLHGRSGRLTQAALETLAVVAYKQPVSRHEVSEVRGVNADGALRTLLGRGLVQEVGRDSGPGQAVLYGTTDAFLEKLGIDRLQDLPPLPDLLPEGPAPDEPVAAGLRAARERLRAGQDLVASGRPRWDPAEEPPGPGEADRQWPEPDALERSGPPLTGAPGPSLQPGEPLARSRGQDMDDLTEALERAARNAMATLEQAMRAAEDTDRSDETDGAHADAADRARHADDSAGEAGP
ncbi:MAG TPA: SMC-Scp complex subunit ScpB [Nitriliruptorales bacterium]|nr:SMC-Scp complex subunit ScpB [Nitriliruptorales bacterium]